jgi:molybdopterin converting factor small subunit
MAQLLLFAAIREAAGMKSVEVEGSTVRDVLVNASALFGGDFERLLACCTTYMDDEKVDVSTPVGARSVVALLPPVSGGFQ